MFRDSPDPISKPHLHVPELSSVGRKDVFLPGLAKMLSTMRAIPRSATQAPQRLLASAASAPPLMWRLAHGLFDSETSMVEKFPGVPDTVEISPPVPSSVEITTLSNGVRVASQDLGGPVSALGLFVSAGSRNETPYSAGVTHALERLAYKGSAERSRYRMVRDMERTGALFSAAASRETIAYCAEGLRAQTPDVLNIMAEAAFRPVVSVREQGTPEYDAAIAELETQKGAMKALLEEHQQDAAGRVTEAIHAAAFHGNTLGKLLLRFAFSFRRMRREVRIESMHDALSPSGES